MSRLTLVSFLLEARGLKVGENSVLLNGAHKKGWRVCHTG